MEEKQIFKGSFPKILIIFVFLILFSLVFFLEIKDDMIDFEVYWKSGKRLALAENLYPPDDGHYVLKYIPFFAFIAYPFSLFSIQVSKALWYFISALFVFLFFHFSLEIIPEKKVKTLIILFIPGVTLLKFIIRELDLGQSNIFVGTLFLIGFNFLNYQKDFLSGLFLAFSFVVKPYSAISLPYLLLKKRFKPFIFLSFLILLFLILPSIVYGWEGNFQLFKGWLKTIYSSTPHLLVSNDNVSVMGMFSKWFGVGKLSFTLSIFTILILLLLFVLSVFKGKALKSPDPLEISILLILIPLLSPQGWDYVFLLSLPSLMILVNSFKELPFTLKILIAISFFTIGFSLFDLMGRRAYEKFMEISVITIAYFAIIFSLFYLRMKRIA